jgi:hypothetical protein
MQNAETLAAGVRLAPRSFVQDLYFGTSHSAF